jgi:hypothetical protein
MPRGEKVAFRRLPADSLSLDLNQLPKPGQPVMQGDAAPADLHALFRFIVQRTGSILAAPRRAAP